MGTAIQNATEIEGLPIAEESSVLKVMMAYHFFGLLWTNQLIQGIGIMTVSGAVGKWYFNATSPEDDDDDDDDEDSEVAVDSGDGLSSPVLRSCCRTVRFHLGSIMFGAFIIAVVQFLRAALAYLDSKTKDIQDKNKLLKILMKVVKCILWCFEKCVKYVSKMAYIQTAIKGTSFCASAFASVKLIMSELALIGIINTISAFIMSISKVLIAVTAGFVGLAWIEYGDVEVSSSILPVLVIIIFAYFTATGVLGVYDTSIDTILLCFLLDKKHNDSEDCHAGPGLKKFISKNKSKKKNKKEKGEDDSEDEGEDDDEYDSVSPSGDGAVSI